MALIKKDGNYMGLPMNIQRGNPIPLDFDAVWYSYDAMAEYARGEGDRGAVAYVGQILSLVDEIDKSATAYIILNEAGDLLEVGSATLGDDKTITLDSGVLGLKDFGSKYYRYVAEYTDEETQEVVAAHYEAQEVDETHPWKAGLEPKVVSENGQFVLGWYEPNPTTIEGVNTQIAGIQNTVDDLSNDLNNLESIVGSAEEINSDGDIISPATGLFAVLNSKVSHEELDNTIAEAIADLDHLKRTTVESKDDIDVNKEDADKYIYMVPNGDVYDEYMVIDGKVELIGNTSIDLSGKVDIKEGYDLVANSEIEKLKSVKANAEMNIINSVDEDDFSLIDRHLTLNDIPIAKVINLQQLLDSKLDASDESGLMTSAEKIKLSKIEDGAQVNFIKSVTNDFRVSSAGQLSLNNISIDKVSGLSTALDDKVDVVDGKGLSTNDYTNEDKAAVSSIPTLEASVTNLELIINGGFDEDTGDEIIGLTTTVGSLQQSVADVTNSLNKYVLQTDFDMVTEDIQDTLGEIALRLQWKDI